MASASRPVSVYELGAKSQILSPSPFIRLPRPLRLAHPRHRQTQFGCQRSHPQATLSVPPLQRLFAAGALSQPLRQTGPHGLLSLGRRQLTAVCGTRIGGIQRALHKAGAAPQADLTAWNGGNIASVLAIAGPPSRHGGMCTWRDSGGQNSAVGETCTKTHQQGEASTHLDTGPERLLLLAGRCCTARSIGC